MTKRYRLLKDLPGFLTHLLPGSGLGFNHIKAGTIFVYDRKQYCYGEVLHISHYIVESNPDWFELIPEQDMSIFEVGNIVVGKDGQHILIKKSGLAASPRDHYFQGFYIGGASNTFHFAVSAEGPWTLVKKAEPKQEIKPKAPAYIWNQNKDDWDTSDKNYSSLEEALTDLLFKGWYNVQWPAAIDQTTGMYPGPK